MKIHISDKKHHITIWIPSALLSCSLVRRLIISTASKSETDMQDKELDYLLRTFAKTCKQFKGLRLVEVISSDGQQVTIDL